MPKLISWRAAQRGRAGSEYGRLDDTKLGWPAVIFLYFNAKAAELTAALGGKSAIKHPRIARLPNEPTGSRPNTGAP
jgi:hypothetical protein